MEEKEKRDSFVFYRSFLEAIDQADTESQLKLYRAIALYALNGEEPRLVGLVNAVWLAIKPQLDANYKRFQNGKKGGKFGFLGAEHGKKGGAPKGNQNARKNKNNPPNVNVNVNDELFEYIDSKGKINWVVFEKEVRLFAKTQKIPKKRVEEFIEYTFNNWVVRVDDLGASKLYDRNGAELENWKGAFINFAKTDYEGWKEEHGLTRPKKTSRNKG